MANIKNGTTFLHWKTSSEINASHFEVEISIDGRTFEKTAIVKADNQTTNNYSFSENTISMNTFFCRLKMVDKKGNATYSKIIKLSAVKPSNFSIDPNPSNDFIIIKGMQDKGIINFYSIEGKLLKNITATSSQLKVDISNIKKGYFLVQYLNNNETITRKLLKE